MFLINTYNLWFLLMFGFLLASAITLDFEFVNTNCVGIYF
jgi:hypothetical protein